MAQHPFSLVTSDLMTQHPFSLVTSDDGSRQNVVALVNGQMLQAADTHPNFQRIHRALVWGTLDSEALADLFDGTRAVADKFQRVSERTTIRNGHVYFDGDPVPEVLERQVLRFLDAGVEDWKCLVAFWENLSENPQEHSRTQALNWLNTHDFAITPDGMVVGYKGLDREGRSIHSGGAIVDGREVTGKVPNADGSVIEMARSKVNHNPSQGCSYGLHVGTYAYAKSFGSLVKEVHVNPRDIVSVPTDCSWAKMRTCRYTVVKAIEAEHTGSPVVGQSAGLVDDGEELCPDCEADLDPDSGLCFYCD